MSRLFCFGLGYSAAIVARRMARQGWAISGTSTTAEGAAELAAAGYRGFVFDGREAGFGVAEELHGATHVLLSIPPGPVGDPALRWHGADLAQSPALNWIGYFSTVGVYGDAGGGWVNEETAANPSGERGQRRLAAERAWQTLGEQAGKTVAILRLPGIYGPGRSAIDDLKAGTARRVVKPGQVFNRIHVDDIATAVEALLVRPGAKGIFNITDDDPSPPQDVVAYGAELLGLPCPPDIDFRTADLSEMGRGFYADSKRVSNAKMKAVLGVRLAYPSYRDGLAAIAAAAKTRE
ncbi:MAG: SDR family oxidoreductase [Hyphomicrobium sp.]